MDSLTKIESSALKAALAAWTQDLAPHGIIVTDCELKIRLWNRWLEKHSGLPAAQVTGRSLSELFPNATNKGLDDYFDRALQGETSVLSTALHRYLVPFPSTVPEANFAHMQQTARITPLLLDGKVFGTITIIEDVTEREFQTAQSRKQHARERLLSWGLSQLLQSREPESVLDVLMAKVAEHLGAEMFLLYLAKSPGHELEIHCSSALSSEKLAHLSSLKASQVEFGTKVATQGPETCETLQAKLFNHFGAQFCLCHPLSVGEELIGILCLAGKQHPGLDASELEFLSTISQYIAVAVDRARKETALMRAQEELRTHADQLEQKVEERTTRLTETITDLEGFCYSVSHDLRAPLRHITGYSQALRDEPENLSDKQTAFLDRIEGSAKRMDILTRDLLRYSKISREDIQMEMVNLGPLLKDIVEHHPLFQHPEVVVIEEPLQLVLAQPGLLKQCLSNLLENAIKFVRPGTAPRITVKTEERPCETGSSEIIHRSALLVFNRSGHRPPADHDDRTCPPEELRDAASSHPACIRIWVEDNGIGIDPSFTHKIFGIFERACNPSDFQGTGIGLAIVAKGMQRMGGKCGVESKLGEGSRFWLEFPAA